MSKESRLIKTTAIIAIGNICTKCISFFMLPLYTTLLSTEQFGTVDLITTYSTLLIIVMTLQFEQGVFRYLIDVRDSLEEIRKYISTAFASLVVINSLFVICAGCVLSAVAYKYTMYLLIMVISGAFYGLIIQIPRGLGDNLSYAFGSCLCGSLHVLLNVLFIAVFSWGVEGMLLATVLSYVIAGIFVFVKIRLYKYINVKCFNKEIFYNLAKYSFPLIPYTMCWWIINASDRTIINIFLGTAANGIYAAAYKFPSLFSMVSNIFQLAWTESASENVQDKARDVYYDSTVNKSIRFYSSCNIGIIALMPFLFGFLIREDFVDAYFYIPVLMTAALFHAVAALYGSIYFAFKETKKVAYTTALSAFINIIVNVLFIKQIGLYAAAISSLCAYFIIILIRVNDLKRIVNIRIKKSYLLSELLVYCIVWGGYYSRNIVAQVLILILLVPYCILQNKETLLGLHKVVLKKVKK